jgi:hypothetical protein
MIEQRQSPAEGIRKHDHAGSAVDQHDTLQTRDDCRIVHGRSLVIEISCIFSEKIPTYFPVDMVVN